MKLALFLGLALLQATPAPAQDPPSKVWYRGNTHSHTLNSDGDSSPEVVARWYRDHGYQFLFITDHDYATDITDLAKQLNEPETFLILPGEEITQNSLYPGRGRSAKPGVGAPEHVSGLFTSQLITPVGERRCESGGRCYYFAPPNMLPREVFRRNFDAIAAAGGIGSVNHPNFQWGVQPEDLADIPDGSLIEVWNTVTANLGGDDGKGHVTPSAEGFWDWLLSRGKVVWGIASDDSHKFKPEEVAKLFWKPQANGWINVHADALNPAALKAAISRGEFYASTGVDLSDIRQDGKSLTLFIKVLGAGTDGDLDLVRYSTQFVGNNGKILATIPGVNPTYRFAGGEEYVRAVVTDSNGFKAWTQPVFIDRRKPYSPYKR